ncbi:MAG: glycosyltransferase, partial [Planctomycetes bacterium]|nr:glycosyltransferase [Planctomycetota bacterium]
MKALVLLYYWPPSGGPGVQRGVKLCSGLLREGVEPIVVTVDPAAYRLPGEYAPDPTLAGDTPQSVRVTTTPSGYRRGPRDILTRLRVFRAAWHADPARWFERQAGWLAPATDALLREIRATRPDVLLTSSQPYTAHLAGRAAKLATGIPWVADFRDPWTLSWGRSWPSRRALDWELRREEEVLGDADVVIANTPGTRGEFLGQRPWLDPRKVRVVRNGYDPEDFRVAAAAKPAGEFRIVHAGSFRARPPGLHRRGLRALLDRGGPEPVPYDLSTHSPKPLFDAVARLAADQRKRVRVRLVGAVDVGWMNVAREAGL